MSQYSLDETRRQLLEVPHDLASVVASIASIPRLGPGPVLLCGCGDSRAAARMAAAGIAHRRPVEVVHPWELSTGSVIPPQDAVVVLISASGRSESIVEAARQLLKGQAHTVALTGNSESPLARMAHGTVTWALGPARRAPSPAVRTFTATHTTLLALLNMLPKNDGWVDWAEPAISRLVIRVEEIAETLVDDPPEPPSYVGTGPHVGAAEYARAKSIEISGLTAVASDPDEWFHVDRHGAPPFGPLLAATQEPLAPSHVLAALRAAQAQGRRVAVSAPVDATPLEGTALLSTAELPPSLRPWGLALLGVAVGLRQATILGRGPFVLSTTTYG